MLSNKEIICPINLLDVAHKKKDIPAGIVNAGKMLPMLSVIDAVKENLINPILIGDKDEIKKCGEELQFDISKYEIIHEPKENSTAKIAAKLAIGYTLDELKNEITKVTPASFEPTIDYVVTKIPRFTFEKFSTSPATLGTSMKSVGEAMSIGRNFKESLQKALVSLETGYSGLDRVFNINRKEIEKKLRENITNKLLLVAEAFRKKINIKRIYMQVRFSYL